MKKMSELQINQSGVKCLTHDSISGGFWNENSRNHGNNLRPFFCFNDPGKACFPDLWKTPSVSFRVFVYKSTLRVLWFPCCISVNRCSIGLPLVTSQNRQQRNINKEEELHACSFFLTSLRQSWLTLLTAVWHYG